MIGIIGGGLAGIAAALEIKLNTAGSNGQEVVLLEARNRLGGATWSFEKNGVSYDNGQHVFLRCCEEYREFLERVGSADSVYLQPRLEVPIVNMGGANTAPTYAKITRRHKHLLGSLMLYKHLKPSERLHAIKTALALRKLDPNDPNLDKMSFGDWLEARGESPNAVESLWNLIVLPTINVDTKEASLKLAVKVFLTGLLTDARGADIGWGLKPFSVLHDQASRQTLEKLGVKVRLNTKVQKLELGQTHKIWAGEEVLDVQALILAVPHNQLGEISPSSENEQLSRKLLGPNVVPEALGLSPILNAHYVFDRRIMKTDLLAGLNTDVQYVFDRTSSAGLNPTEVQCLAISLSGADAYLPRTAKDLESHFYEELLKIFPEARQAKLLHSMITRENAATFRGIPGSHVHRAQTQTNVRGVYMAGAWTDTQWPATMEGAVRSGNKAARMALNEIGQKT